MAVLKTFEISGPGVAEEHVRHQAGRAGVLTAAALDAVEVPPAHRQFVFVRSDDAAGGSCKRSVHAGGAEAHHRSADDHFKGRLVVEPQMIDEMLQQGAVAQQVVAAGFEIASGDGDDSFGVGLAVHHRAFDGVDGGHVVHGDAEIVGSAVVAHLDAGESVDQRSCGSGGIKSRQRSYRNVGPAGGYGFPHGSDGLGLVVLDGKEGDLGFENMLQDPDPLGDLSGFFSHQSIVGGEIRLALAAVDDEHRDFAQREFQFASRRKARAAHAGHSGLGDYLGQLLRSFLTVVGAALVQQPLVLPVGNDGDGQIGQSRGMAGSGVSYGLDGAGGGRVNRKLVRRHGPGQHLSSEHMIALLHQKFGRRRGALFQGHNQDVGQRQKPDGTARGGRLAAIGMNAAMKPPDFAFADLLKLFFSNHR